MPGTGLHHRDMVGERMDKAQEACDFERIQKKDKHVHGTRMRVKKKLLNDPNPTKIHI